MIDVIESVIAKVPEASKNMLLSALTTDVQDGYFALLRLRSNNYQIPFCKAEDTALIKNDSLLFTHSAFLDALYASVRCGSDAYGFLENMELSKLMSALRAVFDRRPDCASELKVNAPSAEYRRNYIDSALAYLAITSECDLSDANVYALFNSFVECSERYMKHMYSMDNVGDFESALPNWEKFALYAIKAGELMPKDPVGYLRKLKDGVHLCPPLANAIKAVTHHIESLVTREAPAPADEFAALGAQIKAQVRAFIDKGDSVNARLILEQYQKINPSDVEIAELFTAME